MGLLGCNPSSSPATVADPVDAASGDADGGPDEELPPPTDTHPDAPDVYVAPPEPLEALGPLEPLELSTDPHAIPEPYQNPICKLSVPQASWDLLLEYPQANIEVNAEFELHGKAHAVEIELQGESTLKYAKKSLKLKYPKPGFLGEPFLDDSGPDYYRRLVLKAMYKDQSLVREAVTFDAWRLMGYDAPRHEYCNLFLNGEYYGLYVIVERVDDAFVARRGYAPGGAMYKGIGQKANYLPQYNGNLSIAWEKKLGEGDWSDLLDFIHTLQLTPTNEAAYWGSVDPVYPLERYFDRMVWVSVTQNHDATEQNFYIYRQPPELGEWWVLFPWDADVCLSNNWNIKEPFFEIEWKHNLDGGNYFSRRLVSIDSLRNAYVDRFEEWLDGALSRDTLMALAEARIAQVEDDVPRDLALWPRPAPSTAEIEFDEIRDIIDQREDWLRGLLVEFRTNTNIPDEPWVD